MTALASAAWPPPRHPLRLVGLTGGIGSGKSTVGRMLASRGIPVLDADLLARQVVEPGQPAFAEIAKTWPDVIASGPRLDRAALGRVVFADPKARARLEAITHPRIGARAAEETAALAAAGHKLAFYEASLLVETGRDRDFDGLVVVTAPPAQQTTRVVARDAALGRTVADAEARISAQLPLAEKVKRATFLIDNGGTLEETEAQVDNLLASLGVHIRPAALT